MTIQCLGNSSNFQFLCVWYKLLCGQGTRLYVHVKPGNTGILLCHSLPCSLQRESLTESRTCHPMSGWWWPYLYVYGEGCQLSSAHRAEASWVPSMELSGFLSLGLWTESILLSSGKWHQSERLISHGIHLLLTEPCSCRCSWSHHGGPQFLQKVPKIEHTGSRATRCLPSWQVSIISCAQKPRPSHRQA